MTFFAILVVVVALGLVAKSARVLGAHQAGLVMRIGRHRATVGPGLVWMAPFIDELIVVDLREKRLPIEERLVLGPGMAAVAKAMVNYRVTDPVKAYIGVSNLEGAIAQQAGQSLRREVGSGRDLTSADEARLGDRLRDELASEATGWGAEISRVEVSITPDRAAP